MKTMLLTATAVGAVIAAMILYIKRKNKSTNRIQDATVDAYQTINDGADRMERPAYHAMG